jgi:uncharacterized protein (TIGR02598 family)
MCRSIGIETMKGFKAGTTAAFSLVEVVLALGITTFCLLVLLGLITVGLSSNQVTTQQTTASTVLSAVVSDLYATPETIPPGEATNSLQYSIPIPANPVTATSATNTLYFTGTGTASSTLQTNSLYRLTVVAFQPSSGSGSRSATFMDLSVSWPATVAVNNAAGRVESFVALNRN